MQVYEIRLVNSLGCVLDVEKVLEVDAPGDRIAELTDNSKGRADWTLYYGDRIEISDLYDLPANEID